MMTQAEYASALAHNVAATQREQRNTVAFLLERVAALEERCERSESRLDHIEPTVEGLDQTVREIARHSDVEMWDE